MTSWRVSAWTHPGDPAGFTVRDAALPILAYSGTDPEEPRGRVKITLPGTYDWQNLIDVQNPTDPADTSMIRVYREGQDHTTAPDVEYVLERFQKRLDDDLGEVVEVYGVDWRLAGLDTTVLRWHDWEPGATKTTQPDWIYGGSNVLDGGFEETGEIGQQFEIWHDGTGGTFTLSDGVDTTAPIAWDSTASGVENALENDIASITDVLVTGEGTEASPWQVVYNVPKFGNTLTANFAGITGDTDNHIGQTVAGGWNTAGWTTARTVSDGTVYIFGGYASVGGFEVTDAIAHTGSRSLRINPLDIATHGRYPGGQVVLTGLKPGTYQASIWAFTSSTTDRFRFIARTIWEGELYREDGLLATSTGTLGYITFPASTWTEVTIPDIVVPEGIDSIILRFSNVDASGNPSPWHLDDPTFSQGMPAKNWGTIANEVIDDANVDHVATVERLAYITGRTWTNSQDSGGNNWTREESVTLRRGQKYGRHLFGGVGRALGYTYDLTPNTVDPTDPEWDMHIWEAGNRGTTHTDIGFHVGMGGSGGLVAGRTPKATRWLAEGADGLITEVANTDQENETGVVEDYLGNTDITDLTTLTAAATEALNEDLANRIAITLELDDSAPTPYEDFDVADRAEFGAAGTMEKHERTISEIALSAEVASGGELSWTATITASKLLTGDAAWKEAVYRYLSEFKPIQETAGTAGIGATDLFVGGDVFTATAVFTELASGIPITQGTHVLDGTADSAAIQAVLDAMPDTGGHLYFLPGHYYITASLTLPSSVQMVRISGPGAHFVVNDDLAFINTNNVEMLVIDGIEVSATPASNGNVGFIGGGSAVPAGQSRIVCQNSYFHDIHCAFLFGGGYGGWHAITNNHFENITLRQAGGGFTQGALLGYQEPSNQWAQSIFANNICRNIGKVSSAGFTAYIVYTEEVTEGRVLAIGNQVIDSTGLDEYWGDTAIGVHNIIDNTHESGAHTDLIATIWTQPEFLASGVNIQNFTVTGTLTAGLGILKIPFPIAATLISVQLAVAVSPTGSALLVDVNKNGVSVFASGASQPTVPDGDADGVGAAATVDGTTSVSAGQYLTIDIDDEGATTPAEDMVISIAWRPA